jgi:hypothetical protein
MTEGIAKLSGRLLLAPQSLCAIDDNIVLTGDPADLDGAEGEVLKLHRRPPKLMVLMQFYFFGLGRFNLPGRFVPSPAPDRAGGSWA